MRQGVSGLSYGGGLVARGMEQMQREIQNLSKDQRAGTSDKEKDDVGEDDGLLDGGSRGV